MRERNKGQGKRWERGTKAKGRDEREEQRPREEMRERNKGRETHPSSLHLVGGHDNDQGVLLPHHAPEVVHCSWQAALRGYVVTVTVYGLSTDVIGVDVI